MRKILVTGGLGYIGSHTVVELIKLRYSVVIIDDLSNSSLEVLDGIYDICKVKPEYYNIDLKDYNKTFDFFSSNNISDIIHFAAYKAVGESVTNPIKYYENNLMSIINILSIIKNKDLKINFIFSSSCAVYGQASDMPIFEESKIQVPNSPYGNTKKICEEILKDFCNSYSNLSCISLRYFNPIGAHMSLKIGEQLIGKPQNLIPAINRTALGERKELIIFGNDYNTHDGTCVRDYIDVVDLSFAHIKALKYFDSMKLIKNNFDVFNLGTGNGKTVLEIIKIFEKVTGIKLNYKIGQRRTGDIESAYASSKKANKKLDWISTTPITESISNAWEWQKKISKKNIT